MPHRLRIRQKLSLGTLALFCLCSCGAKTGVLDVAARDEHCLEYCPESTFCQPVCLVGDECIPQEPTVCEDNDTCTLDRCDPILDECVHSLNLVDLDGDEAFAPIHCGGTDCDDTNPEIYPGAPERCNGIDDDCDDYIDEGAQLDPWGEEVPVAMSAQTDSAAGLAWTGEEYIYGYWDYRGGDADVYLQRLSQFGEPIEEEVQVTTSAGDGYGPTIVWNGSELGVVWSDRRDDNFEIFFARFTSELQRLTADIRVTDAIDWSLYPRLLWSGREYLVIWQDERDGFFRVYGQRIGPSGLVGDQRALSDNQSPAITAESPDVAFDGESYHLVWLEGSLSRFDVRYTRFDQLLERHETTVLSAGTTGSASYPSIAASPLGIAVTWEQERAVGWDIILALVSTNGDLQTEPFPVNPPNITAREASILWDNNGFVVLYSGFADSFGLYYSIIDPLGDVTSAHVPVVEGLGDAVGSTMVLGAGEIGISWSDTRSGDYDAYFTRLLCAGL